VSKPVTRHPAVEDDIFDIAHWISRDSKEAAMRFFVAVEETVEGLRLFPGKGSSKTFRAKALAGVRTWFVRGFPNHLIFYTLRPHEIYVIAILHGARNAAKILRQRAK
jgi:plasmid stabilization system protein ParE